MAVDKETLIEWLAEVPDAAEIGIELGRSGELGLLAISGADTYLLVVGDIPYENENTAQSNGH